LDTGEDYPLVDLEWSIMVWYPASAGGTGAGAAGRFAPQLTSGPPLGRIQLGLSTSCFLLRALSWDMVELPARKSMYLLAAISLLKSINVIL
jgi:hypothetical protein